ncbi:MAG: AIPR family protein [Vallitalea sp.]|nr:AIPR family protein [Vallitalea sp.]
MRHFEGMVTVNKEISKALESESNIEFWAMNNGITILSNEITTITNNRLKVKNIQIVNCLQTSFCIYNYFKNNNDNLEDEKRSILLK